MKIIKSKILVLVLALVMCLVGCTSTPKEIVYEMNGNAEAVIARIQEEAGEGLGMVFPVSKVEIDTIYPDLVEADVVDLAGLAPARQGATEIIVVQAAPGQTEKIITAMEAHKANQLQIFEQYMTEEMPKIENTAIVQKGDYIYYVAADNQEQVIAIIESFFNK